MRKNKMMRVASVLLIAVLLTTCAISGTFAKYVTTGGDEDNARVAKFGVEIGAEGGLFAENYYRVAQGNTPADPEGINNKKIMTVESYNGTDTLVAPGTQNDEGLTLSITGTPEVDVLVKVAIDDFTDVVLPAGTYDDQTGSGETFTVADDYYPLVFTLKNGSGKEIVTGTLEEIQTYLEDEYEIYVNANTDLSANAYAFTLTWAWEFENNDQADTFLGDLAAGTVTSDAEYSTDVAVELSVTVTQVD